MLPDTPADRSRLVLLVCFLAICIFGVLEFSAFLTSAGFGPEFTIFYFFNHAKPFYDVVQHYEWLNVAFYRPTSFFLTYWIGDKFLNWHSPAQWRAYELLTLLATAIAIGWFASLLTPRRPYAAYFAAIYFMANPVIYAPLYELQSFDFLHIFFAVLSAALYFLSLRRTGLSWMLLSFGSWALFVIALTCKEMVLLLPAYLTLLSAVSVFVWAQGGSRLRAIVRETARLIAFYVVPLLYWVFHLQVIAGKQFSGEGDYRLGANLKYIGQNLVKYPLWMMRIFYPTTDAMHQADAYATVQNTIIGLTILLVTVAAWLLLMRRDPSVRLPGGLNLAWLCVFLAIPVFSGGYLWHGNLALVGYALLVGVAFDFLLATRLRSQLRFSAVALTAILLLAARTDVSACIVRGIHSDAYRLTESILSRPPLPASAMRGATLVYVEDRERLGNWYYGNEFLLPYVYDNQQIKQVVVPPRKEVAHALRREWLRNPHAYFVTYDLRRGWMDESASFRAESQSALSEAVDPPLITSLGPSRTRAGQGFNVQPDGTSALSINGSNFENGADLDINGKRIHAVYGNSGWLTATLPSDFYRQPGDLAIKVVNPGGVSSKPITFRVDP